MYLDLDSEHQHQIVSDLKQKSKLSWTKLANYLGVNRSMALHYNRGRHRISLSNFIKLCNVARVLPNSFGEFNLIKIDNKEKKATVPIMDENLAEFLGLLAGDGCLTSKYAIVVSCDATSDKRYIEDVVAPKFKTLFGLTPNIRKINRNLLQCRIYSKKIFSFLSDQMGFPIGKKKNKLRIPFFIFENKKFSKAFLRGLFDTDGGFHRHNPFSAKVEFTSYSEMFREDIARCLILLGFKPIKIKMRVYIMSKAGIKKFFSIIKPNNPKHTYKYEKFKQTGQVPRHRDIDYGSEEFKNFVLPKLTTARLSASGRLRASHKLSLGKKV